MRLDHPSLPPGSARPWVVCAAACWAIAELAPLCAAALLLPVLSLLAAVWRRHLWFALAVGLITLSSWWSNLSPPPIAAGDVVMKVVVAGDVVDGRYGPWALGDAGESLVLLDFETRPDIGRGDVIEVEGTSTGERGRVGSRAYSSVIRIAAVRLVMPSPSPIHAAGRVIRRFVQERLEPPTPGRALLLGFLIGDTSGVSDVDEEAMRRAGLSHFTAVSGSNVALFLAVLFAVAGPLGLGPRRRALLGLVGLPVYASVTGFEPSVMRASLMAGVAVAGRLFGLVLEVWQLLSVAVIGLLILDPGLSSSVGLKLSVLATAGVIAGARWPVAHGRLRRALAVSVGAQIAVAPLLLLSFGEVPLVSPLANLASAPLVAASTLFGTLGVIGPTFLVEAGATLAEGVLAIAHGVAGWPMLDGFGLLALGGFGILWVWLRRRRGALAVMAALFVAASAMGAQVSLPAESVVVLDVGQGDAILLHGGGDRFALVDGGPEPTRVLDGLRRYGVRTLDLVVLTHSHADHAEGLVEVVRRVPVGAVWAWGGLDDTPSAERLSDAVESAGNEVVEPGSGEKFALGGLVLEVLGPVRRYESLNNQSVVLLVHGTGRSMLLSGDVETAAQGDLGSVRADVLKVPHHGGSTSDPEWLASVGAEMAVISVGPNDYGHPAPWVIDLLQSGGAVVRRTDRDGDVVVTLEAEYR